VTTLDQDLREVIIGPGTRIRNERSEDGDHLGATCVFARKQRANPQLAICNPFRYAKPESGNSDNMYSGIDLLKYDFHGLL
jgi:hypothetical protein